MPGADRTSAPGCAVPGMPPGQHGKPRPCVGAFYFERSTEIWAAVDAKIVVPASDEEADFETIIHNLIIVEYSRPKRVLRSTPLRVGREMCLKTLLLKC